LIRSGARHEEAGPCWGFEVLEPLLLRAGEIRQTRKPSFAERRNAFDLIGLDQRDHGCGERALVVDATGDHVLRQRPDVPIGHVGHLNSNSRIQHLAGDMVAGPRASAGAVLELGLIRLRIGGELLQVTGRKVGARHQERLLDHHYHWREIGARIVDRRLMERWMKGVMRREAEDELVAVRAPFATRLLAATALPTFSMMTGCPNSSGKRAARMRPTMSAPPPAAVGTTMVSGRAGHSCEWAGGGSKPNVPKATSPLSATSGLECGTVAGSSRIPRHQNTTGCTSGVGHLGTSRGQ
jgi:hypothetical protein